jgi:hypothetical protein
MLEKGGWSKYYQVLEFWIPGICSRIFTRLKDNGKFNRSGTCYNTQVLNPPAIMLQTPARTCP